MRLPDQRDPERREPDPMAEVLPLHPGWWQSVERPRQRRLAACFIALFDAGHLPKPAIKETT